MKSAVRWVGMYLLNLLAATLGVAFATGVLLNVVLKPFQPLIGHSKLFSVAQAPYYPLPLGLAVVAGYISHIRFKGNHRFWVWVVPTVYLAIKIALWTNPSVLGGSWRATMFHFFAGTPSYHPEEDAIFAFYTALAYSFGALLQSSGIFRFERSAEPPTADDQRN